MKASSLAWVITVGMLGSFATALAGPTKIDIAVTPKKEAGDATRAGRVTMEETSYQYSVKLTNNSFNPATGLAAKYRIFIRDDSGKGTVSQQKLKRKEFSAEVPDLPRMGVFTFETEAVKLQSSTLDGGWFYTNGTRSKSADKVVGVWIRILQGDKVIGEYVNPSTLASKEEF